MCGLQGRSRPEVFDQVMRLPQESSVIITGSVREDKRAPGIPGGYEVGVKQIEIVQEAALDYPMSLKDHGRGLRARPPSLVDPHAEPVGDPESACQGHVCGARIPG